MYSFGYNIFLEIVQFLIRILPLKGKKIGEWKTGQKQVFAHLQKHQNQLNNCIWVHVASLGEFEQARPVIEQIKRDYPTEKILLTFFSPSGYEKMKQYDVVDCVSYLPLDTKANVAKFLQLVQPKLALFAKYEYWYNYVNQLRQQNIPSFLFSAIFNPDQLFFKWYGKPYKKVMASYSQLFVQNEASKQLIEPINKNVQVFGDTRIDRSVTVAKEAPAIQKIEAFQAGKKLIIAGSIWEPGIELLKGIEDKLNTWNSRLIVAPHDLKLCALLKETFNQAYFFSEEIGQDAQVLIIDEIGILKYIYQYGTCAYIGGGFGKGIHNTLEPAAFGLPILFGPKHQRFMEAVEMKAMGGAFACENQMEFNAQLEELLTQEAKLQNASQACLQFMHQHQGATTKVVKALSPYLK